MKYVISLELNTELTPKEKQLLYSATWRWLESICIEPTRIEVREASP